MTYLINGRLHAESKLWKYSTSWILPLRCVLRRSTDWLCWGFVEKPPRVNTVTLLQRMWSNWASSITDWLLVMQAPSIQVSSLAKEFYYEFCLNFLRNANWNNRCEWVFLAKILKNDLIIVIPLGKLYSDSCRAIDRCCQSPWLLRGSDHVHRD